MNKSQLVTEFKSALNEEIEEIKKNGGGVKITGKDAKFIDKRSDLYIYQAYIENPTELPDDAPIEVQTGSEKSRGYIVSLEGLVLTIGLENYIGENIEQITITANPYYLLELLRDRFDENKLDFNLSMKAFGYSNPQVGLVGDVAVTDNLEIRQKLAVQKALGSEVSFIWGPPGTGKTYTLAATTEAFLRQGKSVLIVSHTNIAIDNALEKIAQLFNETIEYQEGKIIRFGAPQIADLFERFPHLSIEKVAEKKGESLLIEKEEIQNKLHLLKEERARYADAVKSIEEIKALKKGVLRTEGDVGKTEKRIQEHERSEDVLKKEISDIQQIIKKYPDMNYIIRAIRGYNPEKLAADLKNLNIKLKMLEVTLFQERDSRAKLESEIISFKQQVASHTQELTNNFGVIPNQKDLKHKIEVISIEIEKIDDRLQEINAILANLAAEILAEARVIGTTLTKGYTKPQIYERQFDVVIIDEASMAPMPALFYDCGLAKENVVIVGDFRQLSPIARSKSNLVKKWLKRDIFEQSGIVEAVDNGEDDIRLTQLVRQHRMHPSISGHINKYVYQNKLEDVEKSGEIRATEQYVIAQKPFSGNPVTIVDTSNYDPWCGVTPSYSRINLYTADLAVFLATQAVESGVESVGIITPFRAQTNIMGKIIWNKGQEKLANHMDVSSVHRSQGREKDVIIFDLTDSTGSYVSTLLKGSFKSESMRLSNVAISRAKSKLIFIVNLKFMFSRLKEESIVKQILKHSSTEYPIVDSNQIFDFLPGNQAAAGFVPTPLDTGNFLSNACMFNQALFYSYFFQDLDNECREELIIFSPFIGKNRMNDLEPKLRELVNKGVKVLVFTTAPKSQKSLFEVDKQEIIDHLKKIGVNVLYRKRMHEKLAVIDRKICWYGSLNILSHQNTTESMMRLKGADISKELLRLFRVESAQSKAEFKKKAKSIRYGECPHHRKPLVVKRGKYGIFLSCQNYPNCEFTMEVDEEVVKLVYGENYLECDECGSRLSIRRSRRGSRFLGCSNYPECKFTRSL